MKGQYRDLVGERVEGFVRSENNKDAAAEADTRESFPDEENQKTEEKPGIEDVFPTEAEDASPASLTDESASKKAEERLEAIQSSDLDIHVREHRNRRVVLYLTPSNFYHFHKEAENLGVSMNELANLIYDKRYKR